jgi:hypothetical protein
MLASSMPYDLMNSLICAVSLGKIRGHFDLCRTCHGDSIIRSAFAVLPGVEPEASCDAAGEDNRRKKHRDLWEFLFHKQWLLLLSTDSISGFMEACTELCYNSKGAGCGHYIYAG